MKVGDRLLDSAIVAAEPLLWGFTNRSWRVDLADGRRVAAQQYPDPVAAARRVRIMRQLPGRFAAAGLPRLPRILATTGVTVVTEWVDGAVGSELLESGVSTAVAIAASDVARRLRQVEVDGLDLPDEWASASDLASISAERTAALDGLSLPAREAMTGAFEALDDIYRSRSPVFAHGDLNPTNVLVGEDGRIVALLDVEFARLAPPAFDAAWWDWVIRFHHGRTWPRMREAFEAAGGLAGISSEEVLALQKLRALELAADATPETRAMWLERVEITARWR